MPHDEASVTIKKVSDGSFVIEGSIPTDEYHGDGCPAPAYEFVTNTAPDVDEAFVKAAKLLRRSKREEKV